MAILIVVAALILIVFFAVYIKANFLNLMIKEVKSPLSYKGTVEKLKSNIKNAKGWHIFNIIDQGKEIIENGGEDIGRMTIIQYCHGPFASRMFKNDDRKKISVFSPKSISIYSKSDRQTYFSMMNGELMKLVASGKMKEIILEVSSDVKKIISLPKDKKGAMAL